MYMKQLWKDLFTKCCFIVFEIPSHVNVLPIINQMSAIIKITCSIVNITLIRQAYATQVYIIKGLLDIQNLGS